LLTCALLADRTSREPAAVSRSGFPALAAGSGYPEQRHWTRQPISLAFADDPAGQADGRQNRCEDGTILTVPLEDLPDWLPAWCADHLGGEPAGVLFQLRQVSMVFGLRLPGGTHVVVKACADDGRAVSCAAAQGRLAERGLRKRGR